MLRHACVVGACYVPCIILPAFRFVTVAGTHDCHAGSCPAQGVSMLQGRVARGKEQISNATTYIPGQPGAPWATEHMLDIKAKLWRLFQETESIAAEVPTSWRIRLPKYVRLGFHDCLKYKDGSGGCDGCLDWQGVGQVFAGGVRNVNDAVDHNNGLEDAVLVLEHIYTNPSFPSRTPVLPRSPKDLGMSRADLWAFAAMMAVDFGIELNNAACMHPSLVREYTYHHECHPRVGEPDCLVSPPRPFRFSTGRKDCLPNASHSKPYMTLKSEAAPNAGANGQDTVNFFKQEFNFTGRETVAIMGGHTLGGFDVEVSSFEYTWKTRSGSLFNNGYYRNMVGKPDWFFPTKELPNGSSWRSGTTGGTCGGVGNSSNMRPIARWRANAFGRFPNGGPNQWIQEKFVCACYGPGADGLPKVSACCPAGVSPLVCSKHDGQGNPCEEWLFVLGKDETMLNSDMGLYRNFSVSGGIPISTGSCPGLMVGLGDQSGWESSRCPFNTMQDPPGSTPLYRIVEEYADSNEKFMSDFFPAYEKMLTNGYAPSELHTISMPDLSCAFQNKNSPEREYTCVLGGSK